jgi:PAS domain S-box-containing protein
MAKKRIMVVEDESITAMSILSSLKEMGYAVIPPVFSADEAVEKAREERPDLVLMDIKLRGEKDGIEAAGQIHTQLSIPVVYLTAHSDVRMMKRIKSTEPFGYIIKPFDARELRATVEISMYKSEMEAKLRDSEKKFRTLFESANDSIFIIDPKTRRLLDVNENAAKRLGYTRNELLQLTIDDIDTPMVASRNDEIICELKEKGNVVFEHAYRRKDGTEMPVEISSRVIAYGSQKVFQSIVRDITDRKQVEDALKKSSFYLENVSDTLIVIDSERDIIKVNKEFSNLWGYSAEEVLGKSVFMIFPEEEIAKHMSEMEKAISSKEPRNFETVALTKSGERVPLSIRGSVVFDENKKLGGFIGIFRDITERKQAEEKLEQVVKELVRSNSDLEQFASIASHDLKSPLLSISGFAKLLNKNYKDKLDKDAHEYIDFILNGIDRMENLVNGLLTYSRIGTSSSKLNPVDVNKIFVQAIANLTVEIEKYGAKVTHDSLPTVIGNDVQLEQLLQNMIGNAIKFRGQELPRVHISVDQKGENWVFSVKDNGIGIASEDMERIFNMFHSLHRGEYKGTGIGLAICKKIVELHGGNIWVESQPGKGSIFYFTIPRTRE